MIGAGLWDEHGAEGGLHKRAGAGRPAPAPTGAGAGRRGGQPAQHAQRRHPGKLSPPCASTSLLF